MCKSSREIGFVHDKGILAIECIARDDVVHATGVPWGQGTEGQPASTEGDVFPKDSHANMHLIPCVLTTWHCHSTQGWEPVFSPLEHRQISVTILTIVKIIPSDLKG